jgi:hypothetical protein
LLIWAFIDFENDSVSLYKLPKLLFSFTEKKGRKSITLASVAKKAAVAPQIYTFQTLVANQDLNSNT